MAVGVGGDVDHIAESLSDLLKRHGSLVRRTTRGFVIEVPEDDYLLLLWSVDIFLGLDHVDLGGSGAGSYGPFEANGWSWGVWFEGFDTMAEKVRLRGMELLSVPEEEDGWKGLKGGAGCSGADRDGDHLALVSAQQWWIEYGAQSWSTGLCLDEIS